VVTEHEDVVIVATTFLIGRALVFLRMGWPLQYRITAEAIRGLLMIYQMEKRPPDGELG
jgi:hypothetical protein